MTLKLPRARLIDEHLHIFVMISYDKTCNIIKALCLSFCFVTVILFFVKYLLSCTFTINMYPCLSHPSLSEFHVILLAIKFRNFFLN